MNQKQHENLDLNRLTNRAIGPQHQHTFLLNEQQIVKKSDPRRPIQSQLGSTSRRRDSESVSSSISVESNKIANSNLGIWPSKKLSNENHTSASFNSGARLLSPLLTPSVAKEDKNEPNQSNLTFPQLVKNLQNFAPAIPKKTSITILHHSKSNRQAKVYNFLERPTGWKCFIYHFTV